MSYRILGVGIGVFILSFVWIIAIGVSVIFNKAKQPISFLTCGSITVATVISVVLLCVPRDLELSVPKPDLLPPDYLFILRLVLLAFLVLCLIIGVILMITEHFSVPMYAKPLRKGFSRNASILKDSSE